MQELFLTLVRLGIGTATEVDAASESIFKVGMCLPAGPYVTDEDVRYIVESIRANLL